ncbi:bifunctional 3'-5' exonuclease/DNA polymerase [Streptomyces sp. 3MP-14]|uniref:DNA-directed DNA polymerase n=1 Tax=Streptomyces mimosae TaxID=2586635 RepID=A0A5N6A2X3_9ACTN|nr:MULTISPECIES: bifunctional 3'-5' exonuclease/DNA polymerase [Streptomyces]KAB8162040.1 bifunctional 3'-5' exonuclease/DNA polymerase [Streptomyces mimosae]KAB8173737.1 bifunctional 3'-5' exonuclease/DNA polymerase [Streptomyces sp. 3MP-14]
MAEYPDGSVRVCPLDASGRPAGAVRAEPDAATAVAARPWVTRWVWRSTASVYPEVLAAGLRVERCYDVEAAEALLLGHEGAWGRPRSLAAALARLRRLPEPADPPPGAPDEQPSLFEAAPVPLPGGEDPMNALLAVYAAQLERTGLAQHPARMRLLLAAESAGTLVAVEMRAAGLPWRADVHRRLLDELLGERYPGGAEPRRLAELADEVSRAFGENVRVRPDLPADVIRAFARAGVRISSTRAWELRDVDHPAVAPLLEYKRLYRIWTAHGWSWLRTWVRDGRFRTEYVVGGTMSGRWTTHGGGALQIPKVVRRAVVADPGWRLVVADADQLEPRVLAAISRDRGLMAVASSAEDLYTRLAAGQGAGWDREAAKLALLGAIYGQTSGDGLRHLADLRRRFPAAVAHVDEAALAGERGEAVRTWLGRTSSAADEDAPGVGATARARGRFTRNFVVQGSASEWALLMLAALRAQLRGMAAELVFFQHDEVLVHCPENEAPAVTLAVAAASREAARLAFGDIPVLFPFTTATVECYAHAK